MLKVIGILAMFCDHSGDALIGYFTILNYIGKIAFPIFAFQIVQGYIHTKDIKKYMIRLFIFACISQIPFMLFISTYSNHYYLNIFFTLVLGIIALLGFDNISNKYLKFGFVLIITLIAQFTNVDYGAYGILLIFMFYIFKDKKVLMCLSLIFLTTLKYIPDIINNPILYVHYIKCIIFTCMSLLPICLYNGKQGPKAKYLFYIFYPVHLLILYILGTA